MEERGKNGKSGNSMRRVLPTLPAGVQRFTFMNDEGIGVLAEGSNHTATVIRHDGLALEMEIFQAATYCQKVNANGVVKAGVPNLRQKFPVIDHYFDDDRILRIAISEPGTVKPRQEAVEAIVQRTHVPKQTVEKYMRDKRIK
jgi:hypothetical protein